MRHGSLFSGIGGFDLAAQWMGWENVFQVENDKFCTKVLEKNFLNVKRYGDIREFNGTEYRGLIDIISGGFPCQPFSVAGKQRGESDNRHLWPEMLRVIREVQSPCVVGENVPGIIKLALEDICISLESEGYEVQPFIIPSASIGAWDKRERVWIIANNEKSRIRKLSIQQRRQNTSCDININREIKINSNLDALNCNNAGYNTSTISQQQTAGIQINSDTSSIRREDSIYGVESKRETRKRNHYFKKHDWWKRNWIEVASELCRSNARVSHRMDRITALGNSANPYVAYEIFKAIDQYDTQRTEA